MQNDEPERPLTDTEAHERLTAAREAIGDRPGASVHADTALTAARKALVLLTLALVTATDRANGDLD